MKYFHRVPTIGRTLGPGIFSNGLTSWEAARADTALLLFRTYTPDTNLLGIPNLREFLASIIHDECLIIQLMADTANTDLRTGNTANWRASKRARSVFPQAAQVN